MPTYEYECTVCQTRFERFQKFSDPPVSECPECSGAVRRVIYPAGVVFKGSGWYITDSRPSTSSSESSSNATTSEGKSDSSPATETKSESKAESKSETSSPAAKSDTNASKPASKPAAKA